MDFSIKLFSNVIINIKANDDSLMRELALDQ